MQRSLKTIGVRSKRVIVCLFFIAFLVLGLLTAPQYGQPWDEQDEMDIVRMNGWEYARAFGLDESAFEARANVEAPTISKLTPISQSIERDHGASTFYPLLGVLMDANMSESTRSLIWHMYCWALFTLGAFALYACCRQLGLRRAVSLLAVLFLLLSPRFFAEGHYNNKDIVLFSLTLLTLWQGLALMKRATFPRALCFALFGALAANTKIIGFALWGLCALFVLIHHIIRKTLTRHTLLVGGTAFVCFVAFYALVTPAMWGDPVGFITYLIQNAVAFQRWENLILFRGVVFDLTQAALPWYYLPYMMVATTPLWLLLLVACGQISALCTMLRKKEAKQQGDQALSLWLVTLLWGLPLCAALITSTSVYNGWRHFYFLYGPMLVLAAWGLNALWQLLCARKRVLRSAFCVLLGLCIALTGMGIALQHPYQYVYYQPLVQLRGENFHELDYWNVSALNALEQLAEQTEGTLTLGWADPWSENAVCHALFVMPPELKARFQVAQDGDEAPDYLLENPTYAMFSDSYASEGMQEAVALTAYGQPIMCIYKGDTP